MSKEEGMRVVLCVSALVATLLIVPAAGATSSGAVVSQVYGGGGNVGAAYGRDFVEVFNRSKAAVDLTGWKVQYSPSTSDRWSSTALTGSVAPYRYYLVALGGGSSGGASLPAADASGSTNLSASAGVVRILNASGVVVDLVGYGSGTTQSETHPGPGSSDSTKSTARKRGGCTDTDSNASDFEVLAAKPHNHSATFNRCDAPPALNTVGNQAAHSGSQLTFTLSAFDPDGDPLTYSASNVPAGSTFYADSRTFAWRPRDADVGTYPGVRFAVSDGFSSDTETITIGVAPRSDAGMSTTTVHVSKSDTDVSVHGTVSPDHRGFEVIVRLFRRSHGAWDFVAAQRPILDASSSYRASFARAPVGLCEIRTRFNGDDLHDPSVGKQDFRC
jgi:hypothetical protein